VNSGTKSLQAPWLLGFKKLALPLLYKGIDSLKLKTNALKLSKSNDTQLGEEVKSFRAAITTKTQRRKLLMKTLTKAVAIASLVSASALTAQVANAEVSASAGLASTYLWRGQDLGTAAISGSLDYAADSGVYAGIWTSSGDTAGGTETDLYFGFAGEAGALSYDVGYATYLYAGEDDIDDLAEVYVSVGMDMFSASVYIPTDSDADYTYLTAGVELGDYSVSLGTNTGTDADDYTHVDVSYAYNDKVSFTYSQVVAEDTDDNYDMGGVFVVSYSLPIE